MALPNPPRGLPRLPPVLERYGLILGHGAVGASVFALLAAGPRVLGPTGYTALALTWTLVTIVTIGLMLPGEQVIVRNVSAGASASALRPVTRRMMVLLPVAVLVLPFAMDDGASLDQQAVWLVSLLVATAASVFLAISRGELAGSGAFGAYAIVLFVEMASRLILIAAALALPAWGTPLLAAAVALPFLLSAIVARRWAERLRLGTASDATLDTRLEHLSFTAVSAMLQISLSTAQFWLYRQSPDAALTGAFVTAVSYMRIPIILAGGIMTPLLNGVAEAYVARDRARVLRKAGEGFFTAVGGAVVISALLAAFSGIGMAILYGPDAGLPTATYAWLGASTVAAIAANALTNTLFGCARAPATALMWIPGAVLTTALYASADGSPTAMAIGTTIGMTGVTVILGVFFFARALPGRHAAW